MKIIHLLCLIFLLHDIPLNAKDYRITIALNLNDCITCVSAFYTTASFQKDADILIIIPKEYQNDSAHIVGTYHLQNLHPSFVWSNTLFDQYSLDGNSTISLESKYNTGRLSYRLSSHNDDFFSYVSKTAKDPDTLFKSVKNIVTGVKELLFNGNNLIVYRDYKKEVDVYDLMSQKLSYKITIADSVLRRTFAYSGLKPKSDEYDEQQKVMTAASVPERFQIKDIAFLNDTILLQLNNRFFQYIGPDTILGTNFSFLKYHNGTFLSNTKMEFGHIVKGVRCNNVLNSIHAYNNQIYENISDYPMTAKRYFLGKCNLSDSTYVINDVYDMRIPPIYAKELGCSFLTYYKGYFAFPLIGKLFPLDENGPVIDLKFFPRGNKVENNRCIINAFIYSFVLNDDYVWLVMDNKKEDGSSKIEFIKYDRRTEQAFTSHIQFASSRSVLAAFDPINPDYIIYKSEGVLIKEKAFK